MKKFSYSRTNESTNFEAHGGLMDIAAEVGYMVRTIYGSLMKSDPRSAELFKTMVHVAIADPDSLTWDSSKVNPDVCIAMFHEKKTDHCAGVVAGA